MHCNNSDINWGLEGNHIIEEGKIKVTSGKNKKKSLVDNTNIFKISQVVVFNFRYKTVCIVYS